MDNLQNQERIKALRYMQESVKVGDIVNADCVKMQGVYVIAIERNDLGSAFDRLWCGSRDTRAEMLSRDWISKIVATGFEEVAEGLAKLYADQMAIRGTSAKTVTTER